MAPMFRRIIRQQCNGIYTTSAGRKLRHDRHPRNFPARVERSAKRIGGNQAVGDKQNKADPKAGRRKVKGNELKQTTIRHLFVVGLMEADESVWRCSRDEKAVNCEAHVDEILVVLGDLFPLDLSRGGQHETGQPRVIQTMLKHVSPVSYSYNLNPTYHSSGVKMTASNNSNEVNPCFFPVEFNSFNTAFSTSRSLHNLSTSSEPPPSPLDFTN